ncbi:UNVERIFIED_CONTAM: hypothetical protein K2H54_047335 [Gekko kuhli]
MQKTVFDCTLKRVRNKLLVRIHADRSLFANICYICRSMFFGDSPSPFLNAHAIQPSITNAFVEVPVSPAHCLSRVSSHGQGEGCTVAAPGFLGRCQWRKHGD